MEILTFALETSIPVALGLSVSLYLQEVTRRLLNSLCGTVDRADFWVRVTTILITGFPLVLALAFGMDPASTATIGAVARHALLMATSGIVLGVAVMAHIIMRSAARTPAVGGVANSPNAPLATANDGAPQ